MSTVDIVEEPVSISSSFSLPPFEQSNVFNYETFLVSICVLSIIAMLISFFKRTIPLKR